MKTLIGIILVLLVLAAIALSQDVYQTTVSREEKNVYLEKYYPGRVYVTRWCWEYASYSEVIVNESDMWIFFVDSDVRCDLARVLR